MSADKPVKYEVLGPAIEHQVAINNALKLEKWDAKTQEEVSKHMEALNSMMNRVVRLKSDAPDVIDSIKNVMAMADDKLKGRDVVFEEYLTPDTGMAA